MRILVTGSEGTVGTALVRTLKEKGHTVIGVDLAHQPHSTPFHPNLYGGEDDVYFRADVGRYREIERAVSAAAPDLVYHAAAEFGRWNGEDYYERLWASNAVGTRNLLTLQSEHGFRAVYFSSSEVYGDLEGVMEEERAGVVPLLNDYALSKWVNEAQVINSGEEAVRVRLFNTYGPGEHYSPYRSVACRFIYRLLHGLPIKVSAGHERAHTWLQDCVGALAAITTNFRPGEVYNIGTTASAPITTLADYALEATGADPSLVTVVPGEEMTTRKKIVDNVRATLDLGFRDTMPLREGVHKTAGWMREVYDV